MNSSRLACWGAMLVLGLYTGVLGPVLPSLARRTGVGLGDVGALLSAIFAGAIISTAVAGWAADRYGRRWPLVAGLLCEGIGLAALPWVGSFPAALGLAALLGLGDGALVVGTHVLVADLHPDDEAGALNRLNVFFGVGAVLGPTLAALVRYAGGEPMFVLCAFGAVQAALGIACTRLPMPRRHIAVHDPSASRPPLLSSPLLWLLAVGLLVYVGLEIGLGSWAFSYARDAADLSDTAAALLSGGFWCALTVSRLVSPWVLRRLSAPTLLLLAPMLAVIGTGLLVLTGDVPTTLVIGVLLTGFAFGPVWPVTFAIAARAFPTAAGGASGVLGTVSAVGGLALPWLQGLLLDRAGPSAGIGFTLVGCIILVAFAAAVRRAGVHSSEFTVHSSDSGTLQL